MAIFHDFFFFFLIIYFWLCWVLLLYRLFSSCSEQGLLSSLVLRLLIEVASCRALHLGHTGFSSCGSQAPEHRLRSCGTGAELLCGMWDLPRPGIKPMSPAPADRFFTTELRGKPFHDFLATRLRATCSKSQKYIK